MNFYVNTGILNQHNLERYNQGSRNTSFLPRFRFASHSFHPQTTTMNRNIPNRQVTKTTTTVSKPPNQNAPPRRSRSRQRSAPPTRQQQRPPYRSSIPRPRLLLPAAAKNYYHCRLDPFTSNGSSNIPDASGGKRITYDHRQYFDVNMSSSGGLKIILMPCISNPLWFKDIDNASTGGSVTSDGTTTSITTSRANLPGGWISPSYSEYRNYVNQIPTDPVTVTNPWGATHVRIVSQALRFTYTGQVFVASGMATVFPNASEISSTTVRNVGSAITDYAPDGNLSGGTQAINTCLTQSVDVDWTAKPLPGVGNHKIVDGFVVLNKKISGQHEFTDFPASPVVLTEGVSTSALRASLAAGGSTFVGVAAVDPHWMTPFIQLNGMTVNSSFRLEVLTCVEYLLNPMSVFAPMVKDSPSIPPSLLLNIDKKIADLPVSGHPNFFSNALRVLLTNAGRVTSIFAGPPIGRAVGTISRAFRDTFL